MADSLERRIERLERERDTRNTNHEDLKRRVREVARRYGRQHGASHVVESALREMFGEDEQQHDEIVEFTLEVVVRSKPSSQLIIEDWEDTASLNSVIEQSLRDVTRQGRHLLDGDWSDTEIHSVEVHGASPVRG